MFRSEVTFVFFNPLYEGKIEKIAFEVRITYEMNIPCSYVYKSVLRNYVIIKLL